MSEMDKSDSSVLIENEIKKFTDSMQGIQLIINSVMIMVDLAAFKRGKAIEEFINNEGENKEKKGKSTTFTIDAPKLPRWLRLKARFEQTLLGKQVVPRSLFVSMVSQYDFYIGGLLRWIFSIYPDLLLDSKKMVNISQLFDHSSLEELTKTIIDKEVEDLLRESHSTQIEELEKRTKLQLKKQMPLWSEFIELTERRNLFVHCDGIINQNYLSICKQNGVALDPEIRGRALF